MAGFVYLKFGTGFLQVESLAIRHLSRSWVGIVQSAWSGKATVYLPPTNSRPVWYKVSTSREALLCNEKTKNGNTSPLKVLGRSSPRLPQDVTSGRNLYLAGLLLVIQGLFTFSKPIAGVLGTRFLPWTNKVSTSRKGLLCDEKTKMESLAIRHLGRSWVGIQGSWFGKASPGRG